MRRELTLYKNVPAGLEKEMEAQCMHKLSGRADPKYEYVQAQVLSQNMNS